MMHKTLLAFVFIAFSLPGISQITEHQIDSVYRKLDSVIADSKQYIATKQATIHQKTTQWQSAHTPEGRYKAAIDLYREYRSFDNDSALYYLNICKQLADEHLSEQESMLTRLLIGHQYVVSGHYPEAYRYLQQVRPDVLPVESRSTFYHYWSHFYRELETFSIDEDARARYRTLSLAYADSMSQAHIGIDALYLQRRCIMLVTEGNMSEALRINNQWRDKIDSHDSNYARMAYYRSEIYAANGQNDAQKYWLAISATYEVFNSDRNMTALWRLADIVSNEGDVQRAMRYIDFAWENINRFSTYKRASLMAPIMNDIHNSYQQRIKTANQWELLLVIIVGLLAIVLLGALYYARRERRVAIDAKTELQAFNVQLSSLNAQLTDSNRVKDEYIRNFLELCSAYIEKMDDYRKRINRKLKANQVKDLLRMTESEGMKKTERMELMAHFDAVFLHLFPTYVQDFNSLLLPEAQVYPAKSGSLNTVLRIFALVRLGIDESSKIAEFLDYTPNSIYNYRSRIKTQAVGDRNNFEYQVKRIGMVQDQQQQSIDPAVGLGGVEK